MALPEYEKRFNLRNIITAGLSINATVPTTGENKINLNKVIGQVGNKFTLSDGKIIVGKGISKVLVSASLCFNFASSRETMAYNMDIYKNTTEILTSLNSSSENLNNKNRTINVSPVLIEVKEGDYFQFNCYASKDDTISSYTNRTKITIQAVE